MLRHSKNPPSILPVEQIKPTVAVITALPIEYSVVEAMLVHKKPYIVQGRGAGRQYLLGDIPAANHGKHRVVLSMADAGNNIAASRATLLLEHFPNVAVVIMVGIAGGIPHPTKASEHVRLGDVVVANQKGIIQYDLVKESVSEVADRFPPRPPSASLLDGVRLLQAGELKGRRPWNKHFARAKQLEDVARPPQSSDVLHSTQDPELVLSHPSDPKRVDNQPRIFVGPIASSNTLLKNPVRRDALRDQYGVRAVEMEGSGIADATWNHDIGYLVVRGICDYCDSYKNDIWHGYAAVAAAAYTRALLESIDTVPVPPQIRKGQSRAVRRSAWTTLYHLNLLNGWRFVSTAPQHSLALAFDHIVRGDVEATTFDIVPVEPLKNCRIECEMQIVEAGDPTFWAGIRVRGFDYDIRQGYLVYLRATGTVELYRDGTILTGEGDVKVPDPKTQWTHIAIELIGSTIRIYVNRKLHRSLSDPKYSKKGLVFLHTLGTRARFRNLRIYGLTNRRAR